MHIASLGTYKRFPKAAINTDALVVSFPLQLYQNYKLSEASVHMSEHGATHSQQLHVLICHTNVQQ